MNEQQQPKKPFPSLQEFCVEFPLYAEHPVQTSEGDAFIDFATQTATIDCFCVDCKLPSVFIANRNSLAGGANTDQFFTRQFFCSRVNSHVACFHFCVKKRVLTKIGQSPSMADISEAELRPYRKVLTPGEYRELTRAVGLASHGVGIGSFVYLRRIFENLIEEARVTASKDAEWNETAFKQSRMAERIDLLKGHLPPFLVEQRQLYSILSGGIHSLTENQCLEAFPVVRAGIELILDEKVAAKQRHEKMGEARKHIGGLREKIEAGDTKADKPPSE